MVLSEQKSVQRRVNFPVTLANTGVGVVIDTVPLVKHDQTGTMEGRFNLLRS